MNKCQQTTCIANQDGICIYYREPTWEGFATPECAQETNEMFKVEESEYEELSSDETHKTSQEPGIFKESPSLE